jgi:CRP/FNR family transcriptional regulator, cyclic AMP receptor protein
MNPVQALASTELFSGATQDDLGPLAPALRQRSFARGAYLYHVGDPPTATYVVLSGLVKICYTAPDGNELVVCLKPAGDTFGEYLIFDEHARRQFDAVAIERTECLIVARDSLLYFLDRNPRLMRRLTATLIRRLVDEHRWIAEAHSAVDVAGRVARLLLILSEEHGQVTPRGIRIPLHVSQATLGGLIGGSREHVNRALSQMAARGLIGQDGGTITILRPDLLRRG